MQSPSGLRHDIEDFDKQEENCTSNKAVLLSSDKRNQESENKHQSCVVRETVNCNRSYFGANENKNKLFQYRTNWVLSDIRRNLILVGLVWGTVFTAYNALEVLQSSLNPHYGVISISLIYTFKIMTSLVGPLIVKTASPKCCMLGGCVCHMFYIVANAYPEWFTLLPAGILVGITMGPLWICLGVYITVLSVKYSDLTGESKSGVLSKFNGIIQAVIPLTFVVGNLISSSILKYVNFDKKKNSSSLAGNNSNAILSNVSRINSYTGDITIKNTVGNITGVIVNRTMSLDADEKCGPSYCPKNTQSLTASETPDQGALYVMLLVFGLFNLCGILLALLGLDNLDPTDMDSEITFKEKKNEKSDGKKAVYKSIKKYFKSFFNWQFLMLVPSILYIHLMLALMGATFTKAYVTCSVGINMVGYVSVARGLTGFFTNFSSGYIGQFVNRNIIFSIAILLTLSQCMIWLSWDWFSNDLLMLFLSAAIAGIANGANLIQYSAFLGDTFTNRKTEVFSFYHFWAGIAVAVGFLQNNYVCVKYQLYAFLCVMIVAVATYIILNVYLKKFKPQQMTTITVETNVSAKEPLATSPSWKQQHSNILPRSKLLQKELQALSASQTSLAMV